MLEFIAGAVSALLIYFLFKDRSKPSGTFVMDFTNPKKDVCKLELDEDLNTIYSKKYIKLRVKVYEDNTQ